jgi:hypothetical protein
MSNKPSLAWIVAKNVAAKIFDLDYVVLEASLRTNRLRWV